MCSITKKILIMMMFVSIVVMGNIIIYAAEEKLGSSLSIISPDKVDFSYIKPEVNIPSKIAELLSESEKLEVKKRCMDGYKKSMNAMEKSIAIAGLSHHKVKEFINKMSDRFYDILKVHALINAKKRNTNFDSFSPAKKEFLVKLEVNKLLIKYIGRYTYKINNEEEMAGSMRDNGYVGSNPLRITEVFKEGNLREKFYVLYQGGNYLGKWLSKRDFVSKVEQGVDTWKLNTAMLKANKNTINDDDPYKLSPYCHYRARKKSDKGAVMKWVQNMNEFLEDNTLAEGLTDREKKFIKSITKGVKNPRIPWEPGASHIQAMSSEEFAAFFKTKEAKEKKTVNIGPYIKSLEETFSPQLTGLSATLDRFIKTSYYLGGTNDELLIARLGALAVMVENKDHSSHEILYSSKSFSMPYTPGPSFHKDILPGDLEFNSRLKQEQNKQGYMLPDEYFTEEYVLKVVAEIGKKVL